MTDDLIQEMIDPERPQRDVPRRRRLAATITILALALVGITSLTTGAIFTDRETTSGDLLTGTVDLGLDASIPITLPVGGMAPGDTVDTSVAVTNAGSLAMRYAVLYSADPVAGNVAVDPDLGGPAASGSGDLRDVVSLAVFPLGAAASCAAATAPTPGVANGAVADINTGAAGTFADLIGSNVQGFQANDRELVATTSETLCVRLHLDINADNSVQNTGLRLTLQFDAEQVVNNP